MEAEANITETEQITHTDVLYLSVTDQISSKIRRLFDRGKVSYKAVPLDRFHTIIRMLDHVGTAVIDTAGMSAKNLHQQHLARVIEALSARKIETIVLDAKRQINTKPFSSIFGSGEALRAMRTLSVDELWERIKVNLTRRADQQEKHEKRVKTKRLPRAYDTFNEQLRSTEAFIESLSEQMKMAGLIQRDFLPTEFPEGENLDWAVTFLPCEWVSGDIYDIQKIDEHHYGFYVADVVGHGIPAALLTIYLKQGLRMKEMRESTYRIFAPHRVIEMLNQHMCKQKFSGYQFATCFYGLLNSHTLELTYVRAGHPYPILIREGEPPRLLESRGALVGIFENSEYREETVQLRPRDKVIVYSDGAESFLGSFDDNEQFIFNEDFLRICDLDIQSILDALNRHSKKRKTNPAEIDDVTAIGLEITS